MENFKDVKVGDRLVCINPAGWGSNFVKGGVYEVTEVGAEESESLIRVGGALVHEVYAKDFAVGEPLSSPSGYVSKTIYESVGDVTKTVTYHFEKYEDFQQYEDSLNEEDV